MSTNMLMEKLRIGVDYYPEHWDRTWWVKDADAMAQAGVTTVRMAEFAWSLLEPEEGRYDFSWLDDVVDLFEERGIEVVLCTPTNTPPLWLYEKYPECIQVDKSGHKVRLGIRGHRCLTSPKFRDLAGKMIRAMVSHYADRDCVIAWQIDNELEANHCCCPSCGEVFRNWVRVKYGTVEAVNAAYGNNVWSGTYTSFSQIKPPFGEHQTWLNPAYMLDFNRYASDSTAEYVRWQAGLIREICPNTSITTNNWLCEHMPDFYELFSELDFVSYDNYPTTSIPDNPEELYSHAFHLDLMRGIKRDNFWIMEQLSGMLGSWNTMSRTPAPGMIKGYALQAIAHGADAVLHFRWRTAVTGAEMFWHGLIDQSGVPGRRFAEFLELCQIVKRLDVLNGSKVYNEVAILYGAEQEYAFKIQPQADGMDYFRQLKSFHDAFTGAGTGIDLVNQSADLSGYKVVAAPTMFVVNETVRANLYRFVQQGGTLVLTNRSGVKDMHNGCIMEPLPTVFTEPAGVFVKEYDALGWTQVGLQYADGTQGYCTCWADLLEILPGEEGQVDIVATYDGEFYKGMPAITRHTYGEGTVYYLGCVIDRMGYRRLAENILEEKHIEYTVGLPVGVEVCCRKKEGRTYRFVFNNTDKEQIFLQAEPAMELVEDREEQGEIRLSPFQMKIYESYGR